jgi:hypothetical protein
MNSLTETSDKHLVIMYIVGQHNKTELLCQAPMMVNETTVNGRARGANDYKESWSDLNRCLGLAGWKITKYLL